jgi:hypothetical protein
VTRVPNAVAFVVAIGLVVTMTTVFTTPAGARLYMLMGGLVATLILGLIVAGAIWLRTKLRRGRGSN